MVDKLYNTEKKSASNGLNKSDHKSMTTVTSPLTGALIPLKDVKDNVFAAESIGKGIAIIPTSSYVYAPVNGEVTTVFPTKHALGIIADSGVEIMIHIGLDTVNLKGEYFDVKVREGDKVKQGQLIAEFDPEKIADRGYDLTSPIIITNSAQYASISTVATENISKNDLLLTVQ
ncbi:PTS glucose transporter subunit IIA [Virgibacillus halophilus]|uniref:PTS glucose transporter subunit IIA n=2 Tax=Tigheibacillus halophilus TaxID=361280 RepID=A0ABU5C2V3_9BACI|nr:PTS glucose transporter subunit IIA [Virgibacillus halophilus]